MVIVERETVPQLTKPVKNKFLPSIIKWKGVNMVRQHSFLAAVNEIVMWAEEIDVTRIGIVGDMHSGKSTMAEAIAHAIHKKSKVGWAVRKLYEKDLMDFEATLKNFQPANYIMIFDDVSFLDAKHNKKSISQVKEAVTKIRHLEGGKDVKIILIYNYHYTMGLDKYLRQADFRFFTTVGSSERENMESIVGGKKMKLVDYFAKMRQQGITKKYFGIMMPDKKFFKYDWRKPWIPVLFYNNSSLRMLVSPTRPWLDPICSICSDADGKESEVNVTQFIEEYKKVYPQHYLNSIKQMLKEQGMNTYGKTYISSRRFLDKALEMKTFRPEDLALALGLEVKYRRLRKDPGDLPSLQEVNPLEKIDTT